MSYHHHYKPRDFDFAQRLVTLRRRAGLSQEGMALQVGVTTRAIRNWEGGTNYPSEANLEKLVELYLDKMVFTSEHEQDEAHVLWDQLREVIPRRIGPFDGQWFARLLKERQEQPAASEAQLARLPPLPQRANQGTPPSHSFSRLSRGDWSEAPDVSAFYGRTDELSELERWLLADHCRLVAVLGMGGIGKTALAAKLVQQVAPSFACVLWRSLHNAPSLEEVLRDWLPIRGPAA